MQPDIDLLAKLWPIFVSFVALIVGLATFTVRYQATKLSTDRRLTSVEARLLSLEGQYHEICNTLTRIETILTLDRRNS